MFRLLQNAFLAFSRLVLSLRYRVRVHGWEQLQSLKGGTLILPNHPGYIDPPLVLSTLWPALHPRPLLWEGMFRSPVLAPVMKLLNALQVPDLERPSAEARAQTERAIAGVIEGLKRGDNHILWPAGRVQRDGVERLGVAQALTDILRAVPDAEIVLVRTRGLWGSRFTFAWTGNRPDLGRGLRAGFGWLLANLLVFMPRRRVDITLKRVDRSELPELRREAINPWFEAWYNAEGPEPPTFVPYHFLFGPRTREYPKPAASRLAEADLTQVTAATKTAVAEMLEEKLHRTPTPADLKPDTTLEQLGLNSLDRMELTLAVEQRFGFSGDEAPATVGQLWALAQGLVERAPPRPPPPEWFRPFSQKGLLEFLGDTVPEAFVNRALANAKDTVAADDLAGVLTYERLLMGSLTMARRFARLSAPNVGLMLPASVACDVAFLALHLAGKLPVMLNWTTGPVNLAQAVRIMGLTHVITSRTFVDRLGIQIEGATYLWLEDLRKEIGKFELLRTLLVVRFLSGAIRRQVPRVSPDQPMVVLFTSGSEKAPKAVPLTHANVFSMARAGMPYLELSHQDAILGFLPAFHSFGMTVAVLMPLLGGMRVVYHPDPTDASGIVRKIAAYRPTLLVGTPTFVSYILDRAKPGQLDSLRMIVVGAEKCPPELIERCKRLAPAAHVLEGYGITECSPVVAVNRPKDNRPSTVGKPLPGVEVAVVDPETEAVSPPNQMGMLWVSGPTIFPGYLGYDGPSPFRERDGKRWYVTGDLVEIDADGFIHFRGRLKRFLKAGGEMISLPALEEPLARLYPPTEEGPRVAVEGVETPAGRRIVLFTTEPITLRDANARLLDEGFRGVMRLDEVQRVDKIPVLGTGKTDYKVLRACIQESSPQPEKPVGS